jgi:hypothetical protein
MSLPLYIVIIVSVIYVIALFVFLIIRNEYREFKKLEDEVQRQADESERPYVEPLYRRKYGKGKK